MMRRIGALLSSTPYTFSSSPRPPASDRMDRNSEHGQPLMKEAKTPQNNSDSRRGRQSPATSPVCSPKQGSTPRPGTGPSAKSMTHVGISMRTARRHSVSTASPPLSPSSAQGAWRSSSMNLTHNSSLLASLGVRGGIEAGPAFKHTATPTDFLYLFADSDFPSGMRIFPSDR